MVLNRTKALSVIGLEHNKTIIKHLLGRIDKKKLETENGCLCDSHKQKKRSKISRRDPTLASEKEKEQSSSIGTNIRRLTVGVLLITP